jgi:hypothetical protein
MHIRGACIAQRFLAGVKDPQRFQLLPDRQLAAVLTRARGPAGWSAEPADRGQISTGALGSGSRCRVG